MKYLIIFHYNRKNKFIFCGLTKCIYLVLDCCFQLANNINIKKIVYDLSSFPVFRFHPLLSIGLSLDMSSSTVLRLLIQIRPAMATISLAHLVFCWLLSFPRPVLGHLSVIALFHLPSSRLTRNLPNSIRIPYLCSHITQICVFMESF